MKGGILRQLSRLFESESKGQCINLAFGRLAIFNWSQGVLLMAAQAAERFSSRRELCEQGFVEKSAIAPLPHQLRTRDQNIVGAIGIKNLPLVAGIEE